MQLSQTRYKAASQAGSRAGSLRKPRTMVVRAAANVEQLQGAKKDIEALIKSSSCHPILIRLGWHDAGTFDKDGGAWPRAGGATGSIRLKPEIGHGANAGLQAAIDLVEPIKAKYPDVSYADLYQMASAVAIEVAGGPKLAMRYGRKDVIKPEDCAKEGNLPSAGHPFPEGSVSPAQHLRHIFGRMGLTDQEIVALSGAHTLGRARPDRSGWGKDETRYTKDGPGNPGGQSWTADWLTFNNAYFRDVKAQSDDELLVLPTDAAVFDDAGFR
ncbi:L-ascorbate peroxidase [Scenedesmus sp. NREL 46B-D3]|nr:L-ascorbate peroxidase [Scenedesmus sp. NREL 46B-D3]